MNILKWLLLVLLLLSLNAFGQAPIDVASYLNNRQVSKIAKDFYKGRFKASDDKNTMSIVDSLKTRNNTTRPFYIYLVSKIMTTADGALSEAVGYASKEFFKLHPNALVEFLYANNKMVEKKFISAWALQIAGEIMIDCEGNEKQCIRKSLQKTGAKTTKKNKARLTRFYKKIEGYCH